MQQHLYWRLAMQFISIKFKEHKPDPRLNILKSSFAQHLIDEDHSMGFINTILDINQSIIFIHQCYIA